MTHMPRIRFGLLVVALSVLPVGHAAASAQPTEHAQGLALIRQGDFDGAVRELSRVTATGCRSIAFYLLGGAYSQLYEAGPTIRAITAALSCRSPALPGQFRPTGNQLLLWARRWLTARRERIRWGYSEEGDTTNDVSLQAAERQRAEAEAAEINRLVALADSNLSEAAVLVDQAEPVQTLECRISANLLEGCERADGPPPIALPPE